MGDSRWHSPATLGAAVVYLTWGLPAMAQAVPGGATAEGDLKPANPCAAFSAAAQVAVGTRGQGAQRALTQGGAVRSAAGATADAVAPSVAGNTAVTTGPVPPLQAGDAAATGAAAPNVAPHGFCFTPRGSLELSFTDNVLLTQSNRKADYITIPTAGLNVNGRTPHMNVNIDGSVSYDIYGATTRLNGLSYNGLADIKANLIGKYLTVDARAATNAQFINPLGASPASDRTLGQNQAQVLNYGATPDFHWRAGDFFDAETKYDISLVNYYRGAVSSTAIPASNTIQQSASINLKSGPNFSRLTWTADGSISRQDRAGPNSASDHRVGEGSLIFAVIPNFQVVATGGYDDVVEPTLNQKLGGVHITGGFRWSLSPRTKITFDGGRRYHKPYYTGEVTYSASAALVLHATYTETIETPQSLAGLNLANIISNPVGNLVNSSTGLPANPNDNPFGLSNQAFRDNTLQFGVTGELGRTSYSLGGAYERRNSGTTMSSQLTGTATLRRQLSRALSDSLSLQYTDLKGLPTVVGGPIIAGTKSETVSAREELDYTLGAHTTLALSYIYQRKHALPLLRTLENVGLLTLNRTF